MANQFPHPFNDIFNRYKKLYRELPVHASNVALKEFKENFRRQGYRDDEGATVKWQKRKNSKITRPILTGKTKRLKTSFHPKPSFGVARVINDAPYAQVQNEGFKGTQNVGAHNRRSFHKVRTGTGVFNIKTHRERLRLEKHAGASGKVKAFKRKMDIPARPFMVTTKALINEINKETEKQLNKIFK